MSLYLTVIHNGKLFIYIKKIALQETSKKGRDGDRGRHRLRISVSNNYFTNKEITKYYFSVTFNCLSLFLINNKWYTVAIEYCRSLVTFCWYYDHSVRDLWYLVKESGRFVLIAAWDLRVSRSACGLEEALIIHKDTCSWCSTNSRLWWTARRGICQGTYVQLCFYDTQNNGGTPYFKSNMLYTVHSFWKT